MSSDINTLNAELDTLNETKQQIKQAIIDKGQPVETTDSFRSYVQKINDIETGVDTSDANATANDLVKDKTAYVNGEKITGTLVDLEGDFGYVVGANSNYSHASQVTDDYDELLVYSTSSRIEGMSSGQVNKAVVTNGDVGIQIYANKQRFANEIKLTPEKLVKGSTVLGVVGTTEVGGLSVEETQEAEQLTNDILGI